MDIKRFPINICILSTALSVAFVSQLKFLSRAKKTKDETDLGIYIPTNRYHFYLAVLAFTSFKRYVELGKYYFIDDGSLSSFQKKLFCLVAPGVSLIEKVNSKDEEYLKKFPNLFKFYERTWMGKKLFIPFFSKHKKVILLDSDTISFSRPSQVISWIKNKSTVTHLFLEDYAPFYALPVSDMERISKRKINHFVNTGLLCLIPKEFRKRINFQELSKVLFKMETIIKSEKNSFIDKKHFFEQSLFCFCLSFLKSEPLDKSYALLWSKTKKITFLHFTPDNRAKNILYYYLLLSFLNNLFLFFSKRSWYEMYPVFSFVKNFQKKHTKIELS